MLSNLFKQVWLVGLMVCAISLSGLSYAFSPMMSMSTSADLQTRPADAKVHGSNSSVPPTEKSSHDTSHCQSERDVHAEMPSHMSSSKATASHCVFMSDQMDCQNCPLSICQISNAWLQVQQLAVQGPIAIALQGQFSSHYQAQHLVGFWQKILRPPKA